MNCEIGGLSHIVPCETENLTLISAEEHLDKMLYLMKARPCETAAIVAGYDRSYIKMLKKCCAEKGVPVSGSYKTPFLRQRKRDIVIIPSLREIWIYAEAHREKIVKKF